MRHVLVEYDKAPEPVYFWNTGAGVFLELIPFVIVIVIKWDIQVIY